MFKKVAIFLLTIVLLSSVAASCKTQEPSQETTSPTVTANTATTANDETTPTASTAEPAATAPTEHTMTVTAPAEDDVDADLQIASRMSTLFSDLVQIQDYYSDGLNQMTGIEPASSSTASHINNSAITIKIGNSNHQIIMLSAASSDNTAQAGALYNVDLDNVPEEFLNPLPSGGAMPADEGSCPAGARPAVTFFTSGGDAVTPDMISGGNINAVPSDMVTSANEDPGSLMSYINGLVDFGDQNLINPEYWDTVLWNKLGELAEPVESLMDYHIWTASDELEQLVVDQYRQLIVDAGAPEIVLNAYDNSNKYGWYSNVSTSPEYDLAEMQIEAEMTGSVSGTVHEKRDFVIPGLSSEPVYGIQTGSGTVVWTDEEIGEITFDIDIMLDQYDEKGRAINGYVEGTDTGDSGYQVVFTFLPDGTKEGKVMKDGEEVGNMTMQVNHNQFENYIDVSSGKAYQFPMTDTIGE